MNARLQRRACAIVLAATVAFVFQLGYMVLAEEPYPAIMMPRFGWAGPKSSGLPLPPAAHPLCAI